MNTTATTRPEALPTLIVRDRKHYVHVRGAEIGYVWHGHQGWALTTTQPGVDAHCVGFRTRSAAIDALVHAAR